MNDTMYEQIVSAIENKELQAYYQPQYNPRKGVIGGAEALVRWIKPDGVIVSPSYFIPELEAANKVGVVDWYIAEEACKTLKELGPKAVKISVNFGREHAKDENFVDKLNKIVEKYDIDRSLFGVEITESYLAADKDAVIEWVSRVSKAGYTVSIDDFGFGMSSLSFVKDVPAEVLKIDKSFLEDNCQSEKGRITLEAVFYLTHRLRLTTVVEGIETKEQLDFINTCDCDYIQGFIFSKPVPHDDFIYMCTKENPVLNEHFDPISRSTAFGQAMMLIDAVYKKFSIIIFANLTNNSYHVMKKRNFIDAIIPETGTYDEGVGVVKSLSDEIDYPEIDRAFSRENLIAAYNRGEEKVLRIVRQHDNNGVYHRIAIEDYFMDNPDNDDIFMVCFIHRVEYADEVYLNNTRPIND
ncbi:EAL domain, c-di-GMP-specific phosphodiesterase class I (or its enzymatically inactive variant) [Pseudobutyrivibrio sp. ACV-2]|uniref:EAL domain-containing protein n=1 Tax=Pseudobutyrivibrio sp. ACV-2 TaxID=1520801 RepID=UPI000895D4CE|nr:EAL domain-containing protein [Pseudobutyrivibrio sp. ACV-2]SEA66887.1 EAL domain, c-di-GMP-specific phosphodiesterase class I (or its enzymatically inactive variant) [Pseudobutyrivibrio sp. ACV-2]